MEPHPLRPYRIRLNLCRALAHDPELLFLDEPTSGLDPANTRNVVEILQNREGERKDDIPHHPQHAGGPAALRQGGFSGLRNPDHTPLYLAAGLVLNGLLTALLINPRSQSKS